MILGYKEKFPWGEPTNFKEKILAGEMLNALGYFDANAIQPKFDLKFQPKIHTFRIDPHDRWKVGMKMDMVYRGANYQIKDRFYSATLVSMQKIRIEWTNQNVEIFVDGHLILQATVTESFIGSTHYYRHLNGKGIVEQSNLRSDLIAINDGFSGLSSFFKWFNKDWQGKILHWTDFRY